MGPRGAHPERHVQFTPMPSFLVADMASRVVYSVVLDIHRNLACSGSMDGTVRVWNLSTGQCQHTLTGHTSLVGLLGLSASYLVSAAADSTLRVWDPESGELRHTLAAHNGAITCFQHDEFKVLSGSDGTLKMWDIRDGTQVRDLLTGIVGVWQIVFEGRWCVAASNRVESTVLDVWDFGNEEGDEEWEGEPANGLYDEDSDEEDEDAEQVDEAMDQDLDMAPSDTEDVDIDETGDDVDDEGRSRMFDFQARMRDLEKSGPSGPGASSSPHADRQPRPFRFGVPSARNVAGPSSSTNRARVLPSTDETPTRRGGRQYHRRR